jgi:hypothetical protein
LGFAVATWDGWEISQAKLAIAQNDPQNANITDIAAFAVFCVKGRSFDSDLPHWGSPWVAQMLLCKNDLSSSSFDVLIAEHFSTSVDMMGDDRLYKIRFHAENLSEAQGSKTPVKALDAVNLLRIDVKFLTNSSEIVNGAVWLVANNNIHKQFQILPKTDTNPAFGHPGVPYTVVATNVP